MSDKIEEIEMIKEQIIELLKNAAKPYERYFIADANGDVFQMHENNRY